MGPLPVTLTRFILEKQAAPPGAASEFSALMAQIGLVGKMIAQVLRRLVEFTQAGGEINLVVDGINVGAQPYWNAEATMLMHTRGILIMTPNAAMVLTGQRHFKH